MWIWATGVENVSLELGEGGGASWGTCGRGLCGAGCEAAGPRESGT